MLEIVLWVICTVHHTTRSAGCCSKVLLSCILVSRDMSEVAEILTWVTNTITVKKKPKKNPSTTLNILPVTFAVQYLKHNVLLLKKPKTKQEHTIISWSSFGLPLLRTGRTLTEGAACCAIIEPEGALQGTGGCRTFFNLKIKTFFTRVPSSNNPPRDQEDSANFLSHKILISSSSC